MRAQGASQREINATLADLRRTRLVLPASDPRSQFPMTRASGRPGGGNLFGAPAQPHENADDAERDSFRRQNETATALSRAGYRTYQNPDMTREELILAGLGEDKAPDLIVENRVFDVYSPVGGFASVYAGIRRKVSDRQAFRIVVNLEGSSATRAELERALRLHPIPGLLEVITIDHRGRFGHAYP